MSLPSKVIVLISYGGGAFWAYLEGEHEEAVPHQVACLERVATQIIKALRGLLGLSNYEDVWIFPSMSPVMPVLQHRERIN